MNRKFVSLIVATAFLASVHLTQAQQPSAKIGFLSSALLRSNPIYEPLFDDLRKLGYVEGKNLTVEFRSAEGKTDRLPDLAVDLVRQKVDVIVAFGPELVLRAVTHASKSMPIVMVAVDFDPIALAYIAGLARPGGNVTGLFLLQPELSAKRVEVLKETFPKVSRVAALWDVFSVDQLKDTEVTAKALGVQLQSLELRDTPYDFEGAFRAAAAGRAGALIVTMSPVFFRERSRIAELAVKNRLLTMFGVREFVESGGLMAYGINFANEYRKIAKYVDKILKGTKPADLPIEQPMKFEFVINLKTVKQIGLTIPPNVLARADKVIK